MKKKHKVRINVSDQGNSSANVLESETASIPKKLFDRFFRKNRVVIIAPAETVEEVEIKEVDKGGGKNDTD